MIIAIRKFKLSYLFSFVTAVLYGLILDFMIMLVGFVPSEGIVMRLVLYVLGLVGCASGVSLLFHTYISPEVYELFVKEVSKLLGININRFKTIYDCTSCVVAIVMSFAFFGLWEFEGVKLGTVVCALVNGYVIGMFSKVYERYFEFKDGLKLRRYFE